MNPAIQERMREHIANGVPRTKALAMAIREVGGGGDSDEEERCPECGGELDEDGDCSKCDAAD